MLAFGLLANMPNPAWADVWTLYRSSVLDPTMRIHVGTFDARSPFSGARGGQGTVLVRAGAIPSRPRIASVGAGGEGARLRLACQGARQWLEGKM
jgi:hypothetical protein